MQKYIVILLCLIFPYYVCKAQAYINANIGGENTKSKFSSSVNAGYNFTNWAALEGGLTFSDRGYGIIDGAFRGNLPLSNNFSLFAKAGLAGNLYYNNMPRPINSEVGLLLGAGLKFDLSKNWAINLEDYAVTSGPNFLMAGLQFNF